MPIPDFQSVMRPVLVAVSDGQQHKLPDVMDSVCQHFHLTEEERAERLPSGKQTIIKNRIGWARTYLTKAGLLTIPGRAMIQITERGQAALQQCPERVDVRYLKGFPEFVAFHTVKATEEQPELEEGVITAATPDEQIAQAYQSLQDALTDELMQTIQEATPAFFEQLVVDLMIAMGYGGSRKEAGKATKATGDDGIDGIIKEDKLGLDIIYLQAKRWREDRTVHRPEIDKFIGALTRAHAKKGVFITTSDFSAGAREAAAGLDMKIVLIDGHELAGLMIEHGLGVTTKDVYTVKKLDADYFSED
jgi:restriction system protein